MLPILLCTPYSLSQLRFLVPCTFEPEGRMFSFFYIKKLSATSWKQTPLTTNPKLNWKIVPLKKQASKQKPMKVSEQALSWEQMTQHQIEGVIKQW